MHRLTIQTRSRTEFVNITGEIRNSVAELGIQSGAVTVFVPHTTAGITINENADPDVIADLAQAMDRMVPWNANYRHGEGNSAAHVKATLTGSSVRVLVEDGRLQLGTWQGIFFAEFDGPRTRHCWVAAG